MKRLVICIVLLLVSCNYFETKKVKADDIAEQELETIDWNTVDEYPSFSACDTVSGKQPRKLCFETVILQHVNDYLSSQNIVVSQDISDTISMKLRIDSIGKISVLDIKTQPKTLEIIPDINDLLNGSIEQLPKIYPALKRGQQVNTEFVLPVIISIK
ncbi:MAG: hypothetical protein ED556_00625 [Winogradskyella sp.]|uniref:hypothetical protein n=1 Tax=Winogradskyella sp. TaxID=1883156 RepID=UPI000F3EEBF2|nr:hypothetical protein [Winogradskyella sp.]RNC87726.1 MAG: hypothetical protein ED556_00625 [Winogradskyella sp.]